MGRVSDTRVLVEAVGHQPTHALDAVMRHFAHDAANLCGRPPGSDPLGKHACDLAGTGAVHGLHPLGQACPDECARLVGVVVFLAGGLGRVLLVLLGGFRRLCRYGMLGCPCQGLGELASVPPALSYQARGILSCGEHFGCYFAAIRGRLGFGVSRAGHRALCREIILDGT